MTEYPHVCSHYYYTMSNKTIEQKYVKKTQLEHILSRPDTYVGAIKPQDEEMWVFDDAIGKIVKRTIQYVPGLYKIFDEIIVNAIDHSRNDPSCNTIDVAIDAEACRITVKNNGKGIEVDLHKEHGVYVPELVFGELLTSSNYDDTERRITGGRNGLGAKLTNVFSKFFSVETVDAERKKKFYQEFTDNMSSRTKPVVTSYSRVPYTTIAFQPDLDKFGLTSLTTDMVALMKKRIYDVAGLTDKVKVFYNGVRIEENTFKKYISLYHIRDDLVNDDRLTFEDCNERWTVGLVYVPDHGFENVSFVNGICTYKGGSHVNYVMSQVMDPLMEAIRKKAKDSAVKPAMVKEHFVLFLNATVENPAFSSQTKEELKTVPKEFGVGCQVSDKFIKRLAGCGVVDQVVSLAKLKEQAVLKKTDGKKTSTIKGIPKLDDASWAGTKRSKDCFLILTEGDSAKALAIAGRATVGAEKFGVFPLKGKLLNVREASPKQLLENEEVNNLKKILGLQQGRVYTNTDELRYGGVIIFTDADADGSHIKGLLLNFFHFYWPSLLKLNYVHALATPIIKATANSSKKETVAFYNLSEYQNWKDTVTPSAWTIKYYKGLGTSSRDEAVEYFTDVLNKLVCYSWEDGEDKGCDDSITLAFDKKRADDRKEWLLAYDKDVILQTSQRRVTIPEFVDRELIHFSNDDINRSIPSVVDGLKPSTRKILYGTILYKLLEKKDEKRVSQLAGFVSANTCYHHGEASLNSAIVGMAQNFVGSNNINLLYPSGQFGCLDPNTEVLRWDGSIALAKDIQTSDLLVGDDGQPRRVLKTTSGSDTMYQVTMRNGETYVVNSQHILTLRHNMDSEIYWKDADKSWMTSYLDKDTMQMVHKAYHTVESTTGKHLAKDEAYAELVQLLAKHEANHVIDIKVTDYLALPKSVQRRLCCVKNSTCIEWKHAPTPIDPYIFGCWLGDGSTNGMKRSDMNPRKMRLERYNLFNNKHIPVEYLRNDEQTRLQVLAGLIDTDGTLKYTGGIPFYELALSMEHHKSIIDSARILAGSLGYVAKLTVRCRKTSTGKRSRLVTLKISGNDLGRIPSRIPRKQILSKHARVGNPYTLGFEIKELGQGEFCGWQVDGNERFLLGDFTITHNSRLLGGKDSASERYIFTYLAELTRVIFRAEDDAVLEYLDDDGVPVEPEWFAPIIPMVLVNGAHGIGTGFSTSVPSYSPLDIVENMCRKLRGEAYAPMTPWFHRFKGTVETISDVEFQVRGLLLRCQSSKGQKFEVTELPVGTWTTPYKEFLETLVEKQQVITEYEAMYTDDMVRFQVTAKDEDIDLDALAAKLKLVSKHSLRNMHLYNSKGRITKYASVYDIMDEFFEVRLAVYCKRKAHMERKLSSELEVLESKKRFIQLVLDKFIVLERRSKQDIIEQIKANGIPPLLGAGAPGYEYLTDMSLLSLSLEKVADLEQRHAAKSVELRELRSTSAQDMWHRELSELTEHYGKWASSSVAASGPVSKKKIVKRK